MLVGQPGDALQARQRVLPAGGLHADDADVGILLLQVTADAADGAARADAGIEAVDPAAGLLPDFGAGRAVVRLHVEFVLVLVGAHVASAVGFALHHALNDTAGALCRKQRAQLVLDLDQFRAEKPQQRFLFFRRAFRDRDLDRQVARIGHGGQRDAGVAGGGLDERLVGPQLQTVQHEKRRAVLDGPERVHPLQFHQHLVAGVRVHALAEPDHRRRVVGVGRQVDDAVVDAPAGIARRGPVGIQLGDGRCHGGRLLRRVSAHCAECIGGRSRGNETPRRFRYALIPSGYKERLIRGRRREATPVPGQRDRLLTARPAAAARRDWAASAPAVSARGGDPPAAGSFPRDS